MYPCISPSLKWIVALRQLLSPGPAITIHRGRKVHNLNQMLERNAASEELNVPTLEVPHELLCGGVH